MSTDELTLCRERLRRMRRLELVAKAAQAALWGYTADDLKASPGLAKLSRSLAYLERKS